MKKKILLGLLVLIGLLTITGCGKTNSNETDKKQINTNNIVKIQGEEFYLKSDRDLKELHYKENYVDFNTDQIGNMRTMSYTKQGNVIFEVRTMYDENRSIEELKAIVKTQSNAEEQSKIVSGIEYIYYDYKTDDGLTVHHYIHIHNGKVYSIGFFLGENAGNIEEVFMNNVSFNN